MTATTSFRRVCRSALLTLGCAALFGLVASTSLRASDAPAKTEMKENAPALPVTATFEKGAATETGPYTLTVKNDSDKALKVHGKVLLAVAFHADNKARHVPEQVVEAGKTMTVPGLAAGDKVTLKAKGYAPLELTVK